MIECETITRKWGNSLGITLPKHVIEKAHIKEQEKIKILIIKRNQTFSKAFGMLKGRIKKSAQQIKDELRRELHHE